MLVNLSMLGTALEQEVIAAAITTALVILHLHASDVHQHSLFNQSRAATFSEALTSEVSLLQNFRTYKKWIPFSMEKKSFPSKESDTKI